MAWETFPYSYTSPYIHLWIVETLQIIIFWVWVLTHTTPPLHDTPHPTPPLHDPPHPTPPLHDTPHPTPTPPHPSWHPPHPTPPLHDPPTPAPSLIFEFWPTSIRIYVTPALNMRPGLNLVALFTYIQKFPAFKLVSFMAYTYNIWGWRDGTRQHPLLAGPHDGSPITAPQPHSNSHFVYI